MKDAEEKLLQQLQSLKDPCPPLEALAELVEGKISLEDRVGLESHIHSCLSCLNRLNDLWETLYLAEKGEIPPPAFVEEAKRILFPKEARDKVEVVSVGTGLVTGLATVWKMLRDWMTTRLFGELAVAAAAAAFLIVVGPKLLQQELSNQHGVVPGTALTAPAQQILGSLEQLSSRASGLPQIAATLDSTPATPVINARDVTRGGALKEEVRKIYDKAARATVLILTERGQGTGAVINEQGQILTNWHVVQGASRILVIFKPDDGAQPAHKFAYTAVLTKSAPINDLALLQIQAPPTTLPVLPLGDPSTVVPEQDAYMIGHPKGREWTFTTGVIRKALFLHQWRVGDYLHEAKVILTQTTQDPGTAGGPVLNAQGELIGLNASRQEDRQLGLVNIAVAGETINAFLAELQPTLPAPVEPGSATTAYRTELVGEQIVGIYVTSQAPPPDLWLVYHDTARTRLAYAVRGQTTTTQIDTVIRPTGQDMRDLIYYFDTNCDGIIDLVGYGAAGQDTLDRYEKPPQPLRLSDLAQEFATATQKGSVPYPQIRVCS